MDAIDELRRRVCAANRRLPALGLAPLNFGNASGIDRAQGIVVIKPSGADYDALRPEDMVLVALDGIVLSGALRPSTDTPTHLALYRAFPTVGGVVHTHSPSATAFAQAGRGIPALGTTHADFFHGAVRVTRKLNLNEIDGAYEAATGDAIVEAVGTADPLAVPAMLVDRHAPFIWGPSVEKAVEYAQALEFCAGCALASLALDPRLTPMDHALHSRHFFRKHGPAAYYGQPDRP